MPLVDYQAIIAYTVYVKGITSFPSLTVSGQTTSSTLGDSSMPQQSDPVSKIPERVLTFFEEGDSFTTFEGVERKEKLVYARTDSNKYESSDQNIPFKLRLLGTLKKPRTKGSYVASDVTGLLYVVREEVVHEAIMSTGIEEGGWLPGKYVWGEVGTLLKLTRVHSAEYKKLSEIIVSKPINQEPVIDFTVGDIYATASGTLFMYLGSSVQHNQKIVDKRPVSRQASFVPFKEGEFAIVQHGKPFKCQIWLEIQPNKQTYSGISSLKEYEERYDVSPHPVYTKNAKRYNISFNRDAVKLPDDMHEYLKHYISYMDTALGLVKFGANDYLSILNSKLLAQQVLDKSPE